MGKSTDTFTLNLQRMSDTSHDLTEKLLTAIQKVKQCNTELERAIGALIASRNVNDTKLQDDVEKARKSLVSAEENRDKLSKELAAETKKLEEEKKKFSDYISKKEKSKNPFKGKKSIPVAKDLIRCAEDLIRKNKELFLFTPAIPVIRA